MIWILLLVLLVVGAVGIRVWSKRHIAEVDDYYEREQGDPPISDLGSYLGGDR